MDQIQLMKIYVAVADNRGFAAAARQLNMSAPSVTRSIATLENNLGVKLLNRTTRHVHATEAGARYLTDVRKILAEIQTANDAVAGINKEPHGRLTVTAPVMFGQMFILPGIIEYLQNFPNTQVDAIFLDRVVNLMEEGMDVGIRIGELPDSNMRALKVGSVRSILCASPKYIKEYGMPQKPIDLKKHTIIKSKSANQSSEWNFANNPDTNSVRVKPRLTVTTNEAAIKATCAGFGICRLLSYQVATHLASGELKVILPDTEPKPYPINIIHRTNHLAPSKIRSFIDLIAERLRQNPALNS